MAHAPRKTTLLAAACSALGLAGVGLLNPPVDTHAAQPSPKSAPRQPAPAPREKEKPAVPARAEPRTASVAPKQEPAAEPVVAPKNAAPVKAVEPTPAATGTAIDDGHAGEITPDIAMQFLCEGNERWVNGQAQAPNTDSARREETAQNGQKPFATVLTCADSRLPVERLFDRGIGDLFVVRVAGNVVSGEVAGTIEYGAEHLHVPLLVVMGHTKCGAVAAAAAGGVPEGNIGLLVEKIVPAVDRARQQAPGAEPAQIAVASVKENVWQSMFDLIRCSSEVRNLVKTGKLRVVGAVCDITTGSVEWIGPHPWQDALVDAFEARSAARQTETADAEHHD